MNWIKPDNPKRRIGFSLAELLAALVIGAMVLVSVIGIYGHAERSMTSLEDAMARYRLPSEILMRIAEDFDKVASVTPRGRPSMVKVNVENKLAGGFSNARLAIERSFIDGDNKPRTLEKIIWQGAYDAESDRLTLYRSHSGQAYEDKLLDETRPEWEDGLFVPVCTGLSYFSAEALKSQRSYQRWTSGTLPAAVSVSISFSEPFKTPSGVLEVLPEQLFTRTMGVDRIRQLSFTLPALALEPNQPADTSSAPPSESGGQPDEI